MKKLFLLTAIFLLSLSYVLAADKILYQGLLYPSETFNISNSTFSIIGTKTIPSDFPNNYTEIALLEYVNGSRAGQPMIIDVGDCYFVGYISYCFPYIYYNFSNPKTKDPKGYLWPQIKIIVTHYDVAIKVDRPSKIAIGYDQTGEVVTKLTNNGKKDIDVEYKETIPNNFIVLNPENITVINNVIRASMKIHYNASKSFSYKLRNKDYFTKNWTASYSYTYEGKNYSANVTKLIITTPLPYTIKEALSKSSSSDIQSSFEYDIDITNNDAYNDLKTKVIIDPGVLQVTHTNNIDKIDNYYGADKLIPINETMEFAMIAESDIIGNNTIRSTLSFDINGYHFDANLSKIFKLQLKGLIGYIQTSKDVLAPGDELTVRLHINNTNSDENYYNLKGYFTTLGDKPIDVPLIYSNDGYMQEEVFNIPASEFDIPNKTKYQIKFDGTYKTINGQEFTLRLFKNVTLNQSYFTWKKIINTTSKTTSKKNITSNITNLTKSLNSTKIINTTVKKVNESQNNTAPIQKNWVNRFFDAMNLWIARLFGEKT